MIVRHLCTPREASQLMGISYPTIKKYILEGKLKTIKTPGGHHRVAQEDIKAFLERESGPAPIPKESFPRIIGGNQLRGHVVRVRIEGLMAEIILTIGDKRMTSIISAEAANALDLKPGDAVTAMFKPTAVMVARLGEQ